MIRKPSISRIPKPASNASETTFVTAESHTEGPQKQTQEAPPRHFRRDPQEESKAEFDEYGKGYQAGYRIGFEAGYRTCHADRKDSATTSSQAKDPTTPAWLVQPTGSHTASGQVQPRRYNTAGPVTRPRTKTLDSSMSCTQYMQTTYHHVARPGQSTTMGSVCSTITRPGRAMTVDSGVTDSGDLSWLSRPPHEPQTFPRRDLNPVQNGSFNGNGAVHGIRQLPNQTRRSTLPSSSKIPIPGGAGWRPTRGLVSHIPDGQKGKWQPWSSSDHRNYER